MTERPDNSELSSNKLADSPIAKLGDQVTSTKLGDETVMLDFRTGDYLSLNEVGSRMFALLQECSSEDAVVELLKQEYEASEDKLRQDLRKFAERLFSSGLLVRVDASDK